MVIKMPEDCTAEKCDYICTKMVDFKGANEAGAAELETLEDSDSVVVSRRLTGDTITTVYVSNGYEADSDSNSEGFDTTFEEEVETTSGASSWVMGVSMLISLLFIFFK